MASTIRILSGNLLNGAADPDGFAQLASEVEADVVSVQELGDEQAEALSAIFPYGLLEPRDDFRGGGIALRHPGEVHLLPLAGRHGYRTKLSPKTWPLLSTPLEVVGVHIYAPHSGYGTGLWRRRPPSQRRP